MPRRCIVIVIVDVNVDDNVDDYDYVHVDVDDNARRTNRLLMLHKQRNSRQVARRNGRASWGPRPEAVVS